ncbi:MAG: tetratricopeptide repeat protein, partial [Planctomycetales bacterium]|nr:tetratricopeptide repeat protein [Planctomycetales bacterium]
LISLDLTTPEIVALIHDAAKALQHAHELGVVHRDIKPSNLLLDEARKIWVTDFGLAQMEDRGTLTLTGDFVGTLRYMSPEQALGGSIPIDHRTDIYSLGATLFELLTRRPLVSGREKIQLLKAIGNMEINFPTGKNRIPRDLETIILKATARERDARYPSAAALAEDLQHFLNHRPIAARRPGLALRISKWAVRNPMMSLVAGSLPILFLIGLAIYNMAISAQKEQVELALQKAQQNENHALLEAQKANTVSEIMQQMVSSANPDQTKGSEYTVRQLLDDLSESLFERLADQPEVAVTLRSTIGNAYRRLGSPERAQNHLQIALDYHVNHRATPVVLAQKYADLAWNYAALQDYAQAVQLARSAVSIHDQLADPSLESVQALWCLQHCLTYKGEYAEADSTADKAIRLAKSMNPVPPTLANVTHDLAQSKTRQGQVAAAIALATEAIELHQQLHGKHHPETGWGFESLARAYQARADFAQAAAAYGSALEIFTENYPPEHKSVRVTLQRLEESLVAAGELERAESVRRSRRRNLFELVLSKSTGTDASLLDYLLEAKSYLAAGELVMSMPEIFDSPAEALRALDILGRYRQALPTSLDFNAAELEKYQKTAQALLDLVIRQCPDEPMMLNNVAWNLLVFADANLRRPADAVRFAERATELKADTGAYWNTLGLAYLRSGREQEAISALTRSQSFETSDEYDTVLLAIAFGRLGDQPKYEEHLKATQQRYARRKQKIEELDLFLAEAESLHAQFSNSVD